jgi:hypothetical protein
MERIAQQTNKLTPAKVDNDEVVVLFQLESGPLYIHPRYAEVLHMKTRNDIKSNPVIWYEYTLTHSNPNHLVWRIYPGHNHVLFGRVHTLVT